MRGPVPGCPGLEVVPVRATPMESRAVDADEVRRLARLFAEELLRVLAGGSVDAADVSPRPGREEDEWRDEEKGRGFSDPIPSEGSGDSSWWEQEAKEIVGSIRRRKRQER